MRQAFCKTSLLYLFYLLALGALVAVVAAGCAQEGGEQGARDQTGGTAKGGTTRVETTRAETATAGENPAKSLTREETVQATQGRKQQRRSVREGSSPDRQRVERQTVTVRITGTEGLAFAGRAGSDQDVRRVQGSVPAEYEIPSSGAAVTVEIHKRQPGGGTLGIEVVRDGRVIARQTVSTTAGEINIVWKSQQEGGNGG